ncbi:MAG TPA: NifU family protein [Bacteroidia bacterium]|jgi:Fe-S cluster biogenesis protein NfuA|nr:NifU family protein [Bacteroidia bacterium]
MENIQKRVEEALNTIRPYLEADGGDVEIIEISSDNVLKLELKGACKTCNMSHMTMKSGIEETIRRAVPEIKEIISVNN